MYPLVSESPHPAWHEIEQGNVSDSTSAMLREYAWEQNTNETEITKAPVVQGTIPGSRHPFPHDPVDPRNG